MVASSQDGTQATAAAIAWRLTPRATRTAAPTDLHDRFQAFLKSATGRLRPTAPSRRSAALRRIPALRIWTAAVRDPQQPFGTARSESLTGHEEPVEFSQNGRSSATARRQRPLRHSPRVTTRIYADAFPPEGYRLDTKRRTSRGPTPPDSRDRLTQGNAVRPCTGQTGVSNRASRSGEVDLLAHHGCASDRHDAPDGTRLP